MKKLNHHFRALLFLAGVFFAGLSARAQVFAPPPGEVIRADTAERRDVVVSAEAKRSKAAADSAKRTERMFHIYLKPVVIDGVYYPAIEFPGLRLTRPGKAALLSALLPGAGQIYNRRWWKLPLVYGALGGVIYGEVFYQSRYRQYADASNLLKDQASDPNGLRPGADALDFPVRQESTIAAIDNGVQFYRGNRDIFLFYIGIAYGLQIVDALVDAHLKDFDVSQDLSLHWQPALLPVPGRALALPTTPGVTFALRVK